MPKLGMEPVRRKALVDAALKTIGARGTLDVTMSEIARVAGVSPALAHHYFGSKDQLLVETMRTLLRQLHLEASAALAAAPTPRARLSAVIAVSFSPEQFAPGTVAAWLAFYVDVQRSIETLRLFRIYARRLNADLMSGLRPLIGAADGQRVSEGAAAMIDGLYIRQALHAGSGGAESPVQLVEDYITTQLSLRGAC
ncbi:MAG: transcriptional regulator BetI [Pararhizobium sp.]